MAGNSKSVKKSEQTKKEHYGPNFHARAGAIGGKHQSRGYFGKLKDEGKVEELEQLSKKGVEKRLKKTPEERTATAKKIWEARKKLYGETGRRAPYVRSDRGQGTAQ